jgi:hypothetical protein
MKNALVGEMLALNRIPASEAEMSLGRASNSGFESQFQRGARGRRQLPRA